MNLLNEVISQNVGKKVFLGIDNTIKFVGSKTCTETKFGNDFIENKRSVF